MPLPTQLAQVSDVADIWRPVTDPDEAARVNNLLVKATAKLRKACPFDIDARIALFEAGSDDPTALDPVVVADRVALIVKRFLVNQTGVATLNESAGPYSRSSTFVNRYDKTGTDVRGELRVTDEDIDELRPAVPAPTVGSIRVRIPSPAVEIPWGYPAAAADPEVLDTVYGDGLTVSDADVDGDDDAADLAAGDEESGIEP